MGVIETRIDTIERRIDFVECRMDEMYEIFNNRMDCMYETLVLLEEEMTTEFPALFEIYSLNYETQRENENRLKNLSETTGKHSIQISKLEETVKNHERTLKELIS